MKQTIPIFVVFCLFLAHPLFSQIIDGPPAFPTGDYKLTLSLYDEHGAKLANGSTYFSFINENTGNSITTASALLTGNTYVLLDNGSWNGTIEVDYPETQGSDYALSLDMNVLGNRNISLQMYETASAQITVKDKEGRLVPNAQITLNCVRAPVLATGRLPEDALFALTGNEGAVLMSHVPTGTCYLSASKGNFASTITLNSTRGELLEETIVLNDEITGDSILQYIAIFAIAIAVTYLIFKKYKKTAKPKEIEEKEKIQEKTNEKPVKKAKKLSAKKKNKIQTKNMAKPKEMIVEEKPKYPKKLEDIMKTLPEREMKIVELVWENKGQIKQSKIRHTLLLPKSSLSRMLRSLERRNVITLQPFGNSQVVKIQDWLLKEDAPVS